MNVKELIQGLKAMPENKNVTFLYDGVWTSLIEVVYLSNKKEVVLSAYNEVCYHTENRPIGSPTEEEEEYFTIKKKGL